MPKFLAYCPISGCSRAAKSPFKLNKSWGTADDTDWHRISCHFYSCSTYNEDPNHPASLSQELKDAIIENEVPCENEDDGIDSEDQSEGNFGGLLARIVALEADAGAAREAWRSHAIRLERLEQGHHKIFETLERLEQGHHKIFETLVPKVNILEQQNLWLRGHYDELKGKIRINADRIHELMLLQNQILAGENRALANQVAMQHAGSPQQHVQRPYDPRRWAQ